MPLPDRRTDRIRARLSRRLPPDVFATATAMGATGRILGYLNDSDGSLDALGQPDRNAVLYTLPKEPTLASGTEVDGRYVVWRDGRTEAGWSLYDLRRLPNFVAWSRITRTLTGRNPETRAPIYSDTPTPFDAYLIELALDAEEAPGEVAATPSGRLLVKGGPSTLSVGDRVEHADFGRFRVVGIKPYGPWAAADLESA